MARAQKSQETTQAAYPHPRGAAALHGHEKAEQLFLQACRGGRLHHAWLLCGMEGIGKATLAYRMARFILVHGIGDSLADTQNLFIPESHQVFHLLAQGTHPDCHVLEHNDEKNRGRKSIGVEQVRDLNHKMLATSAAGGWRLTIVDAVEDLNKSAANALLKILEEPPQRCLFLLISHRPGQVMATIRSRCQKLQLGPLDNATLVQAVRNVMPGAPAHEIEAVAPHACGSVRTALDLMSGSGLAERDALYRMLENFPRMDLKALQQFADAIARKGEDAFAQSVRHIAQWCHAYAMHLPESGSARAFANFCASLNEDARRVDIFNLDRKAFLVTRLSNLSGLVKTEFAHG